MDRTQNYQNFHQVINQPDEKIDLAKAALYIAQEEYSDLEPSIYLEILDKMALGVKEKITETYPLRIIQAINRYLYDELGFRGNNDDYYAPRNSFLNDVLERRTGIPITLALVYLEIAQRVNFPMVGIGMPGHFLIRPEFQEAGIFVDAFNQGEILFEQDCEKRLTEIYQQQVTLQASFVAPVSKRRFLARMLANLKMIYLSQKDLLKALAAVERILLLFPDAPAELRDRGLLYYQLGYWVEAIQDLEVYLAMLPDAEDAEVIRQLLKQLGQ